MFSHNYPESLNSSLICMNQFFIFYFPEVAKCSKDSQRSKRTMLDLYSGCGAMSSGLSIGAALAGETIVTVKVMKTNIFFCS